MSTRVPTSLDWKETDEYEHWNDIQTEVVVSSIKNLPIFLNRVAKQQPQCLFLQTEKGLIMYLIRVIEVQMAYLFLFIRNHLREMKIPQHKFTKQV